MSNNAIKFLTLWAILCLLALWVIFISRSAKGQTQTYEPYSVWEFDTGDLEVVITDNPCIPESDWPMLIPNNYIGWWHTSFGVDLKRYLGGPAIEWLGCREGVFPEAFPEDMPLMWISVPRDWVRHPVTGHLIWREAKYVCRVFYPSWPEVRITFGLPVLALQIVDKVYISLLINITTGDWLWRHERMESGDFNMDGCTDCKDMDYFWNCLSGAGIAYKHGCAPADFDDDSDVDMQDFGVFQAMLGQ